MKNIFKKIGNFFYKEYGYYIEEKIYYYDDKPQLGYIIRFGWYICNLFGYDTIAYCCNKEHLDEEIKLRHIKLKNE